MRELREYNAKITDTFLGFEDHGIFTFCLYLYYDHAHQGYGHYALEESGKGYPHTADVIKQILEVVGVKKWEDLTNKLIRIRVSGAGCARKIEAIGNILEDNWFSFENFFEEERMKDATKEVKTKSYSPKATNLYDEG